MRLSLLPRIALLLLASAPLGAQTDPPPAPEHVGPHPKTLGVEITALANCGYFLKSGEFSVLIDAFLRDPVGNYAGLPTEVYRQLVRAQPPFDGLTVVLVSHDHPDHVQFKALEKFLKANKRAQLLTSPQVIKAFQAEANDFEAVKRSVTGIKTTRGVPQELMQDEMSVTFMELAHAGQREARVVNLGHLIQMGGLKILHVGDAEATQANFAGYHLADQDLDVAFIPYWYFGSEAGRQIIDEELPARIRIATHVPPEDWDKLKAMLDQDYPDVILFKEALEQRTFQPRAAGTDAGSGAASGAGADERGG